MNTSLTQLTILRWRGNYLSFMPTAVDERAVGASDNFERYDQCLLSITDVRSDSGTQATSKFEMGLLVGSTVWPYADRQKKAI